MFEYRAASPGEIKRLWIRNIADNPGDTRWIEWREQAIGEFNAGKCVIFAVLHDSEPVGEGTLLLRPDCGAIDGREELANGTDIANINGLRMAKEHEGKGHMSALVKVMEDYARGLGYKRLTIGVEAREARNLAIYLHWGYTDFITPDVEDGELVLYYGKDL